MTRQWKTLGAWMLIGLGFSSLGACGGGGSSDRTQTGVFLDSPVAGISYSTASTSGTTNSSGQFSYQPGEVVTFAIGDLVLGTAPGSQQVDLFDLAGIEVPPSNGDELEALLYPSDNSVGPLHKVVGMASLLQSLDTDGDAANGIEIKTDVAALVGAANIDLERYYWEILAGGNSRDGRGLPGVLRAAATADLLTERPVVAPDLALQHVVDQLNQPLLIDVNTQTATDNDANGSVDYRRTITYDLLGNVIVDEYDTDGDGAANVVYGLEYNNNSQRSVYLRDDNGDGTPEQQTLTSFDAFGNMVRNEVIGANGNTGSLELLLFDDMGRLIRREVSSGATHTIQHWIVDEFGMRSTYELDTDGDGSVDRRDLLQYAPGETRSDRWIQRDIDLNLDGAFDQLQLRSFNSQGLLLSDRTDQDLDGTFELSTVTTYDDFGMASNSSTTTTGTRHQRWTRDAAGNLTRSELDRDNDGDFEEVTDLSYNAQGLLVQSSVDSDGDGQPDSANTYTYNATGKVLERAIDSNGNGTIDNLHQSSYDAQGRIISRTFDRGNDGVIDQRTEYSGWITTGLGSWL